MAPGGSFVAGAESQDTRESAPVYKGAQRERSIESDWPSWSDGEDGT